MTANFSNEKHLAVVIRAVQEDSASYRLETYWGNGITKSFLLAADPQLGNVEAGAMCYFTAYNTDASGSKTLSIFGDKVENDRVFIREENSNNGFYARLAGP